MKCWLLLALPAKGQVGASVAEDSPPLLSPLLPARTLQVPGLSVVTKGRGRCFPLPEAEQVERALMGSSVFPSHAQTRFQTKELQRP